MKKVVISCGPIPARLDSVKFITNRFKGGLAFKTAESLIYNPEFQVTLVKWRNTPLPDSTWPPKSFWDQAIIVNVDDVFDYYKWYEENAANYDAFVMAAAVANLTPSNPYKGKFPSHNYQVGEKFNIEFEIAPRAIDVIKKKNPRACLIGYKLFDAQSDDELIEIARHTLKDAKANIIFANTPASAKSKKIAVMADNTTIQCSFDEHIELIKKAINQKYFQTVIEPLTAEELENADIRRALSIVKMFDKTFPGFGTVAVPVSNSSTAFATTSRGHSGEPVIVRSVDRDAFTVYATGKATLNAPTLSVFLEYAGRDNIIVHRHDDDLLFNNQEKFDREIKEYQFPGTIDECYSLASVFTSKDVRRVKLCGHGDLYCHPIKDVDWNLYHYLFPKKYFSIPASMESFISSYKDGETLEVGCNTHACTKYAYDPYVQAENAINLTKDEVLKRRFHLIVAKNSINYLPMEFIKQLLERTECFIANTFRAAPDEKITEDESAITVGDTVYHTLRLPDDSIMEHTFFAYTDSDFEKLGFEIHPYKKNSCLIIYREKSNT